MNGRHYLSITLLILAMMVSACSKEPETGVGLQQTAPPTATAAGTPEPGGTNPIEPKNTGGAQPIITEPVSKPLPDAGYLSTFPGILTSMSLTLEDIIKVLGNRFVLYENSVQGYDIYQFSDYNLVFEYDRINEKMSTIWLDDTPYFVYSGTIKSFDIDNDGMEEEIAAYEDEDFNGRVTVFTRNGLIKADQTTDYFGGKCELSFLTGYSAGKENLIILDMRSERDCEVFTYTNGKLISMVPPGQKDISTEAIVEIRDSTAYLSVPSEGISYECPMPEYLWNAYEADAGMLPDYTFSINAKPIIKGSSLILEIRQSLQLKLFEDPSMMADMGAYMDVAQVLYEYQYQGAGKWELLSIKGGPKYDRSNMKSGIIQADFTIGDIGLLMPVESLLENSSLDLSQYDEYDLMSGVLVKHDGMSLGITSSMVSYLSLDSSSPLETFRGLKIGDTRQQARSLYGLPDKGFYEDSVWTFYYIREENKEDSSYQVIDSFNIEFDGDSVSKIWMAMYVSVY
jgi:hypothetical protein